MDAREVQFRHGSLAALGRAEVARRVGPALRVVGANQDDDITKRPVGLLPGSEVGHGDLIVGLGRARGGDVDDRGGADEVLQRNLLDAPSPLREVHGRVEVRAAVFGPRKIVGRVVIALQVSSRRPRRRGGRSRPSARRSHRRCTRGTGRRAARARQRSAPAPPHEAARKTMRAAPRRPIATTFGAITSSPPPHLCTLAPLHPLPLLRLLLRDERARLLDHLLGDAHVAAIGVVHEAVLTPAALSFSTMSTACCTGTDLSSSEWMTRSAWSPALTCVIGDASAACVFDVARRPASTGCPTRACSAS